MYFIFVNLEILFPHISRNNQLVVAWRYHLLWLRDKSSYRLFLIQIEGEYEHNSISSGYSWTVVFLPIWILICGLGIQACRVR